MKRFLEDTTYSSLTEAFAQADTERALAASHTLKGMCGNLSFTELSDLFTRQVALLRAGQFDQAASLLPQIEKSMQTVTKAIRECFV